MTATLKRVFERPAHIEPPASLYGFANDGSAAEGFKTHPGFRHGAVRREACFAVLTAARASTVVRGSAPGRRGDFLCPSCALYRRGRGARNKRSEERRVGK